MDPDVSPHYINGEWKKAAGAESIVVEDPAIEEPLSEVPSATEQEVTSAIEAAQEAQYDWERRPAKERGDLLREIGSVMRDHADELARIQTEEIGKLPELSDAEIDASIDMIEYHSQWDRRLEGDVLPGDSRNEEIHLKRRPHGVVASICPWNSPVAVFARKLGPALVTGNTMVAKPSELTPLSTIRTVELIHENVDLPDGVLNLVTGGAGTGQALVAGNVDMISMTGHRETGKQIMRDAADGLKHISLELGGKAPAIVWKDANIDEAVKHLLGSRIDNCGQYCTAAERVYVHSDVAEEFTEKFVEATENVEMGHPSNNPDIGPQVAKRELDKTEKAVKRAKEDGASILTGGKRPEDLEKGYYYEPTVISDIQSNKLDIMQEEVFGPVLPIMEINSLEEAIEFSNDSRYGLSAYLFTNDYEKAMRITNDIDFGELYINRSHGEAWHAHHPGWNESGMGGDDGKYGMLEFTKVQTVYHNY